MLTPKHRPMPHAQDKVTQKTPDDAMQKEATQRLECNKLQQEHKYAYNTALCKCFNLALHPMLMHAPSPYSLDLSVTSPLMRDRERVDDLRRSAPSLAFRVFVRLSTGLSSSSDSSTVNRSGDGSLHE